MTRLYRFTLDCGRMGTLHGIFLATESSLAAAMGKKCQFGEVLGKHSDISCDLGREHVALITDDAAFIAQARAFRIVPVGANPLMAITCDKCGESLAAPYERCLREWCAEGAT